MKILIVDDKAENLYMLETLLKGSGYEVVTAREGVEALKKLKQDSIEMIISDILMPRMDGFQLCRECKADDRLREIPFLFYTSTYTDPRDEEFALSLGAEKFIVKPVEPVVFLKILKSVIQEYRQGVLVARKRPVEEEEVYLAEYNKRLINKLEKKMQGLENANKELKESEEMLRKSERKLSISNRLSRVFLTVPDEEMYAETLKIVLEVMESKYGIFGYIDEEGNYVCHSMTKDIFEQCQIPDKVVVFPREKWGGIWGRALTEKKSIYSNEPFRVPEGHIPITRAIDVPIIHKGNVIGNLLTANKKIDYDEKDLKLLQTIAGHIAPVLNARLQRDKQDRERRKAEAFITNILESVGEGLSVIDRDYRIVTANMAFGCQCKMLVEDIRGKHCYEISHRTDKPCYESGVECPTKHSFETGAPYSVVHTHKDKDGKPVYVEVRSYPMKDESGNVTSVIEVTNDITEKKKLEDRLRQIQKMEAIGQLAGGIAHDFNNILTAIIGYSNILQMKMGEDDPLRANVDQILGSAHKAAHLTQSLLTFSRQQIILLRPVKLNEIIERIEKLLLRLIGEDIELITTLADKDLTIMADNGQIEQILMNLATNARDAMPEGGVLGISTELVSLDDMFIKAYGYDIKPGMYSLITVSDTGKGIDESVRKKIFEPFFTTKELGRGTGLGLSIIYGIVSQHNGIIDVYSEAGKGTTFKIYLPVTKSGIETIEEEILPPPKGGTETVLVAEDDKEVRELIITVLEEFGYKVIEAKDGEEAVTKFKENMDSINLAILDVIMPKAHGKAAYQEIQKLRPESKAIFVSGYGADIIDKKGALEKGAKFVQKPISPNELLRSIREVLDN